jgi:hypothetical protein
MAKPPNIRNMPVADLQPGEDLDRLRLYAERYEWLRQRAVKVQGSEIWYSGNYLDLRVDIGLGHRNEDE